MTHMRKRRMRKHSQHPVKTQPIYPLSTVLWHYRRRLGGLLALVIMSAVAGRRPAEAPTRGPRPEASTAAGDTARVTIYRTPSPIWGIGEEPFPENQKRVPCTPDLEITWKGRCWMPHRTRNPPCDAPGILWAYEKMCIYPVPADAKNFPNTLTP